MTREERRAPLLHGAAGALIEPMFDIIIEMRTDQDGKYQYRCKGTKGISAKNRGYALEATEEADMMKLWQKITTVTDGSST